MTLSESLKRGYSRIASYAQESVTLRVQTSTRNSNDDPVKTNADSTINAVVQIMTLDDVQETGGGLQVGDAIIFVDSSITFTTGDNITNLIIHKGITYEIKSIVPEYSDGNITFQELHCKRYQYA